MVWECDGGQGTNGGAQGFSPVGLIMFRAELAAAPYMVWPGFYRVAHGFTQKPRADIQ